MSSGLRRRISDAISELAADVAKSSTEPHPSGHAKHGTLVQGLRMLALATWSTACCATLHATQLLGAWLYFINKDYYYAWMAMTKQSFGLLIITITQWFSPTTIRVSGEPALRSQLQLTAQGRLSTAFPERLVLIANHQLYSDWLYLWWFAYTSHMHGHVFIVLKESLKYVPVIGPGMMFFGFIFMARSWVTDKLRLRHRLQKLNSRHSGPMSGSQSLDPMWLLIYPEGTNLSANTREKSVAWAEKQGIKDFEHQLMPRTTGLQYCLQELESTVEWVYDCTVAYEGIPRGQYGQDIFTLHSTYFQGRPPKSVNMYWQRFAVSSIPLHDKNAFDAWVMQVWKDKEALLEHFQQNGRFPPFTEPQAEDSAAITSSWLKDLAPKQLGETGSRVGKEGFLETQVRLEKWWEAGQIFVALAGLALVANVLAKIWNVVVHGNLAGLG